MLARFSSAIGRSCTMLHVAEAPRRRRVDMSGGGNCPGLSAITSSYSISSATAPTPARKAVLLRTRYARDAVMAPLDRRNGMTLTGSPWLYCVRERSDVDRNPPPAERVSME